jgi:hypothetical protein
MDAARSPVFETDGSAARVIDLDQYRRRRRPSAVRVDLGPPASAPFVWVPVGVWAWFVVW